MAGPLERDPRSTSELQQRLRCLAISAAGIGTSSSAGLIVVPQTLSIREAADELILIWAVTKPEEWVNRIVYFPI